MAVDYDADKYQINKQNISYYNEIADSYDAILDRENSNKIVRELVARKFTGLVELGRVLDFGGGTGLDLEWLGRKNYTVFFCEPSVEMRKKAISHNKNTPHNNIIFLDDSQVDFTDWGKTLPFPEKVDAILANFAVLNCIPDIELLFQNLARVVQPGGHLLAVILDNSFKKLVKSHFRSVIRSFICQQPIIFHVSFNEHQQIVYIHTAREIKKASSAYFNFCEQETLAGSGFVLIHLARK